MIQRLLIVKLIPHVEVKNDSTIAYTISQNSAMQDNIISHFSILHQDYFSKPNNQTISKDAYHNVY